jgi:hypothetical protein
MPALLRRGAQNILRCAVVPSAPLPDPFRGPMLRSAIAIVVGFLYTGALSLGADGLVRYFNPGAVGEGGRVDNPTVLLLTIAYVALFAITGCYLAARLAPSQPMRHALILGLLGLVFNIAGAIVMWSTAPAWYHLVSLALVMPYAWLGGRQRELELEGRRAARLSVAG